jgi:hypothetical protein
MILWAEPRDEEFDTIIRRAFDTMQALKEFGTEISPNFLTAKRKIDAKPFEWSFKTFEEAVKNGLNKDGENVFPDLGYSISFFSSCVEKDSASISMTIGVSNSKFKNTLVVNLPQSLPLFNNFIVNDKLIQTFKNCVTIFKPFWGCIANKTNSRRFDGYLNDILPTTTHWVNYWGKDIVKKLGAEKFEKEQGFLIEDLEDGYFLKLKETPINDESADDILSQVRVNKYFGL